MHLSEAVKTPFQTTPAIVMIGRLNPPTTGHYFVIDKMKQFARKYGKGMVPVVVIVDGKKTGDDKERNPLTPEQRIAYMKASGRADGVRFIVAPNAFAGFEAVRKEGLEPMAIAAGSDRKDDYLRILDGHFLDAAGAKQKHIAVDGLDRDGDGEPEVPMDDLLDELEGGNMPPISMISASLAREAVKKDKLKAFGLITGLQKKPKLAAHMAAAIKKAGEQDAISV